MLGVVVLVAAVVPVAVVLGVVVEPETVPVTLGTVGVVTATVGAVTVAEAPVDPLAVPVVEVVAVGVATTDCKFLLLLSQFFAHLVYFPLFPFLNSDL